MQELLQDSEKSAHRARDIRLNFPHLVRSWRSRNWSFGRSSKNILQIMLIIVFVDHMTGLSAVTMVTCVLTNVEVELSLPVRCLVFMYHRE